MLIVKIRKNTRFRWPTNETRESFYQEKDGIPNWFSIRKLANETYLDWNGLYLKDLKI